MDKTTVVGRTAGIAGGSLHNSGLGNIDAGLVGERVVAGIISKFLELREDAVLFNSIKLPGQNWDIDHVLVIGSTVIVIDAKRWKGNYEYRLKPTDSSKWVATRDGADFSGGLVSSVSETNSLSYYLKSQGIASTTESLLVVVGNNITVSFTNLGQGSTKTQLVALNEERFEEYLSGLLQMGPSTLNENLLRTMRNLAHTTREQDLGWERALSCMRLLNTSREYAHAYREYAPTHVGTYSAGHVDPYKHAYHVPPPMHEGKGIVVMILSIVNLLVGVPFAILSAPLSIYLIIWSIVRIKKRYGKSMYWITIALSGLQLLTVVAIVGMALMVQMANTY